MKMIQLARRFGLVVAALALAVTVQAQNGVWTNTAGGSWANAVNWTNGVIATNTGYTADFSQLILPAAKVVTLDGARTIGNLTLGDLGNTYGWTLNTGSAGPLTLAVNSGSPVVTINGQTNTIGAVIAGTQGLTKAGAGSLNLTGASTYSGTTLVSAGTLILGGSGGGSGPIGGSAIVVTNGAVLQLNGGDVLGYSTANPLTVYGTVTKTYAQEETLYRPITLSGGVITNTFTSNSAPAYELFGNYIGTAAGTTNYIAGNGPFGLRTATTYFTNAPGSVLNVAVIVTNYVGAVGQLNKYGAGTTILYSNNTYTGSTLVNGGTLVLTGQAAIGSSPTISVATNALLDVSGLTSPFALGASQTLTAGTPVGQAAVTNINGNFNSGGILNVVGINTNGTLTINGNLGLTGGTINYDLAGSPDLIVLSGASPALSLSGTTTIQPGVGLSPGTYTLITNVASVTSGSAANLALSGGVPRGEAASFTVASPAVTLNITGSGSPYSVYWQGTNGANWDTVTTNWSEYYDNNTADQFYPQDYVYFDDSGRSTVSLVGQLYPSGVTVQSSFTNFYFGGSGGLAGPATLTMSGSASLSISNNNSYTGGTAINSGTVRVGNVNALGSGPLAFTGGVLDLASNLLTVGNFSGYGGVITDSVCFTANTNGNYTRSLTDLLTFTETASNSFTGLINNGVYTNSNIWTSNSVPVTNHVSNTGVIGLVKNGPAYLLLAGASTFSGGVTVNAGTLEITNKALNDTAYTVAQGATLKYGYSTISGSYPPGITVNGSGVANAAGLYLMGGKSINVNGDLVLQNQPTTVQAYGSGTASIYAFDVNGTHLTVAAAASGSVISPTVNISCSGFGFRFNTAAGASTATGDLLIGGVISGSANNANGGPYNTSLRKDGTGSVLLTNASTYGTGLYLTAGNVILAGGPNRLPAASGLIISNGATLQLNGISQTFTNVSGVTPVSGGAIVAGSAIPATLTINNAFLDTNAGTIGGPGAYQNNLSLVKTGVGQLNLPGVLSYTNNTIITAGKVYAGSLTNADYATLSVVDAPGTLVATNLALGTSAGSFVSITSVSGSAAPIVVTNLTTTGITYIGLSGTLAAGADYPVIKYGTLGGAGFGSFQLLRGMSGYVSNNTANSSIDVVLSSATNYPLVWKGNLSTVWDVNTSSNWAFNGTPNVFLTGDNVQLDDTAVMASTNLQLNTAASLTALTVTNNGLNYTISGSGAVAGSGGLTKYGTASLTLLTTNTYTGPTLINGGTVYVSSIATGGVACAIGTANNNATNLVINGGALVYAGRTNSTDRALTIGAAGGSVSVSSNLTLSGAITGSGPLAYNGPGQLTLTVDVTLTNSVTVNGGTLALAAGNLTASTLAASSGLTINSGGTVQVNTDNSLAGGGATLGSLPVTINAGGTLTGLATADGGAGTSSHIRGVLTLNGGTLTDGGTQSQLYYGTWDLDDGVVVSGGTNVSTISCLNVIPTKSSGTTFNVAAGGTSGGIDLLVSGSLIKGIYAADTGVIKSGNGVMALAGANTYTGSTLINAGTLALTGSGSISGTSVISLASNATFSVSGLTNPFVLGGSQTLGGSGTVVGSVQDSGGSNITPGTTNTPGTLNFTNGSLTLVGGETLGFCLGKTPTSAGGTNNSMIIGVSNLTINAGTTLNINPIQVALAGGTYKLITYTGTLTDNSGGIAAGWTITGYTPAGRVTGVTLSTATPGEIDLIVTGNPASLVWQGDNTVNAWDIQTTSNWLNVATADEFYQLDNVTFNDAGSVAPNLDIQAAVTPSAVVVSNTAKNYTFSSSVGQGINGAGSLTKNGTGTLTILNNNPYTGATTINAGTVVLGDGVSNDGQLSGSPIIDNATLKFNVASGQTQSTTISGSGVVTQTGNQYGSLTLNASNSWTGGLNVLAGTAKPGVNFALPIGATVNVASNAQFDFNGVNNNSNPNRANTFIIAGAGPDGYSGALVNSGGTLYNSVSVSNVTLAANATVGGSGRWDIGPATNSTVNGNGYSLTKQGSFVMSFRPQNMTNVASMQIAAGNLYYEFYNQTNPWTAATTNYVASGATLGTWNSITINTPIVLASGATLDNQGSGTGVWTGTADLEPGSTVTSANGSLVLAGTVYQTNQGTVTFAGANTIAFAGTDTISVTTNISWTTGTLQLGYNTPSGSIPDASLYVPPAGTFSVDRSDLYTLTNSIYGDGSMQVIDTNGVIINGSASVTLGGNFLVGQGQFGQLFIQPGASISAGGFFMGNPNAAGGGAVTQTGGALLVTNTAVNFRIGHWATETSTYSMFGGTMSVPGSLCVGYDGTGILRQTNGSVSVGGELYVPYRYGAGIYALEGGSISIGAGGIYCGGGASAIYLGGGTLAATTNWTTGSAMTLSGTNGNLTFDTSVYSNVLGGVLSGPGGLTKISVGTLDLTAANTYTGSTLVSNGTLLLGGTVAGAVTVGSGAEFAGLGTVNGAFINSGLLAPGTNGFGALTVSNTLTLNSGGTVALSINRAAGTNTFGSIKGISSVSYGGTLTVTGTGTFTNGDTFKVFSAGSASGTFTATNLPSLTTGLKWNWNPTVGTLSVVPAVSTAPFTMTTSLSPDGTTLTLSWPSDHIGWRLLVQTNNLSSGISANPADWGTVSGSSGIDTTNITINPALPTEFYQMVYP